MMKVNELVEKNILTKPSSSIVCHNSYSFTLPLSVSYPFVFVYLIQVTFS